MSGITKVRYVSIFLCIYNCTIHSTVCGSKIVRRPKNMVMKKNQKMYPIYPIIIIKTEKEEMKQKIKSTEIFTKYLFTFLFPIRKGSQVYEKFLFVLKSRKYFKTCQRNLIT